MQPTTNATSQTQYLWNVLFQNICFHEEDVINETIVPSPLRRCFVSTWVFGLMIVKSCWVYTNYVNELIHAIKGLLSPDPLQMFPAVKIS